jgi:hypothetical protein
MDQPPILQVLYEAFPLAGLDLPRMLGPFVLPVFHALDPSQCNPSLLASQDPGK